MRTGTSKTCRNGTAGAGAVAEARTERQVEDELERKHAQVLELDLAHDNEGRPCK